MLLYPYVYSPHTLFFGIIQLESTTVAGCFVETPLETLQFPILSPVDQVTMAGVHPNNGMAQDGQYRHLKVNDCDAPWVVSSSSVLVICPGWIPF